LVVCALGLVITIIIIIMKVLWNFNTYKDHFIIRHPDIVGIDKLQKSVQIVNVSVLSDYKVAQKECEKLRSIRIYQLNSHH